MGKIAFCENSDFLERLLADIFSGAIICPEPEGNEEPVERKNKKLKNFPVC